MSALPAELAELSREEKLALLARLAAERARAPQAAAERPGVYPLAFAQQRFWFLGQLDPESYVDNVFRALRLTGPLDAAALGRTLEELVRRHAALRTRFPAEGGEPRQVVEPALPGGGAALELTDLSALAAGEAEAQAAAIAGEEARRPFDLARGPLFRARLLRLAAEDHVLLLCLHHIVCDGWSLGLLLRELAALYGAFAAGEPSPLPAPRATFGDFARWQRQRLEGDALRQELDFWRRRLEGAPAVLELPADHPRRHMASPRGDAVPFAVADPDAGRFKALAQGAGATPFMALLALYEALLFRHTGQDDFVVGVPVANRHRTEFESVVGCFSSTLLMRAGLSRAMSFRDLLARVRREALAVFSHTDLPFEKLVEELQPDRNLSHNPIFQVWFALQTAAGGELAMPGLALAPLPVARGLAKLDLTLDVTELPGGFSGYFEYSTDLFEEPTVARLAGHFQALLAAVLEAPDRGVGELPILSPEERRQLLVDWNRRCAGLPPPILDRLAEQARRTPGSPAVLFGGERLTYAELHARANRLARYLRRLGVGPEMSVGLCVERSLAMPLALLAVLKANGAWVPLDPEYPQERLALMIADTAMPVLLTQEHLVPRLPALGGGPAVVALDRLDLSAEDPSDPEWPIHPESLAYIVYTSGSTGRPKGVAVPHRSLANHAVACAERYRLGPDDRVLQFTSISFDITSEEIFPTWLSGGAVVPRPPGLFPSFGELAALMARYGITAVDLPTAYWHEWVGEMYRTKTPPPPSLRLVVIGTEQALPERVADWLELAGDRVRLNNSYASTEATVTTVVYEPGVADLPRFRAGERVPVGKNIFNCRAYVLDAALEPVPIGVPGDVYIAGPNVSRGYANWSDRTAASFLPDPFAADMGYGAGQRMYRQGDVGRWLPSGDLEYLGRRDDQVKIRGFRVEPAEVGAALARHPAVKDCAVLVRSDGPLGKRLVGYATLVAGRDASARELRDFLRESLPDHMVPAGLAILDSLPLTPNGRVDQRALPDPSAEREELAAYTPPQTATEEILEGIWCEVLGIARAGANDDFFELGGHSLLGTQVVSRARERCRVELPLRALFENPTLAELARRIEELRREGAGERPPRLEPAPRREELPLSFAQHRLWFLDRLEPQTATYNIPLALQFEGGLDLGALAGALGEVARRHEALRTTFTEVDGRPRQVVHPPGPARLPVIDLTALAADRRDAEARRQMAAEARRPFSLQRGPLLRTALLRLAAGEEILLVTMHHIVSDGWSVPIFVREMAALYTALRAGEPPALPELPIQYADFAHWQRGWLQGPVLEAEIRHWRERLGGLPPRLELPADRPLPPVRTWRGAVRRFSLARDLAAALKRTARELGATPFMVLLAGFAALLHRYSRQESFAVGVPVAGRNRVEIEPLIGFFVNTLVLRCDVAAGMEVRALVEQVRETVLDADAHQDVPFERLVEELAPERSLSHSPLLQVMLTYLDVPREEFAVEGLKMTPAGLASGTSKFDLTLSARVDDGRTVCDFEYSTELFDAATVGRLVEHLVLLLAGALADPKRRLAELPLLAEPEQQQLSREWNDGLAAAAEETVPRWFEATTARRAAATALEVGDLRLSYGELDARANQLAHRLLALGVGREAVVGVCLERSADLVVALLAVLKAGAAYLPLDPAYPRDRLSYILQDSGAVALISERRLAADLPTAQRAVLLLAEERESLEGQSTESPAVEIRPGDLAYVIYTSGSTGRPKGVLVEHGNLANVLRASRLAFGFDETDVMPALAPFSFDIFLFELLNPLLAGGTAILVSMTAGPDLGLLAALLERATRLHAVPALMQQIVEHARPAPLAAERRRLRTLFTGGDTVPAKLLAELRETFPGAEVRVLYGPTEGTIIASSHRVPGEGAVWSRLGRPLSHMTLQVADPSGQPSPIGVPGELWIGGRGVSRGYLGRPELTAERFVPDPWGPPGSRLYRSGDLARRLAEGELEFLGRSDHQVKIRGFRVEPGEIEAALARHPAVAQAAVVVRQDAPGSPQLAAYYVPAGEPAVSLAELRAALREELPDYMIPSWLMALPALPLSANGKVDRQALPAPDGSRPDLGRELVPPAGPVQERLAAIWAEILRLERVGAHDNFFELGGHSLMATQVLSRMRQAFGFELPLRALFENPTVAGLAEAVVQGELERADDDLLAKLLSEMED